MNATQENTVSEGNDTQAGATDAKSALQSDAPRSTPTDASPSIFLPLLGAALVGGFVGAAASSYVMTRHLNEELALRPPIAVVDAVGWVKSSGEGDTPMARLRDGAKRLNTTVETLHSKGVLVLDASSVRSAPPAVVISTPHNNADDQSAPGNSETGTAGGNP